MSGMNKNSGDNALEVPGMQSSSRHSPSKKSKRSKHRSSKRQREYISHTRTDDEPSAKFNSFPTLTKAALRTSMSSNTLSNYATNILSNRSYQYQPVTREELEQEIESISFEISKLNASIEALKEEKEQETLEQKLTFLKLSRRCAIIWNFFLVCLLFFDTFKKEFETILLMMKTTNKIPNSNNITKNIRNDKNLIAITLLFLQHFPTIFSQTISKAIRKSILFAIALACLIQTTEMWRNTGATLSVGYSLYLLYVAKPKWKYVQFHFINIILNGFYCGMRYYCLHGLSSFRNFQANL